LAFVVVGDLFQVRHRGDQLGGHAGLFGERAFSSTFSSSTTAPADAGGG
jgi:hypothetical protein